jgi:predicted P-loop ATPase
MQRESRNVDEIRALMEHPPGARKINEDGSKTWVKSPLPTLENIEVAIKEDPVISAAVSYDELRHCLCWNGEPLTDAFVTHLTTGVGRTYKLRVKSALFYEQLYSVARMCWSVNPLKDYLEGLIWDGIPRLGELLTTSAGAPDTQLVRSVGTKFAVSAVARALEPGCKVDTMMIFAGGQGTFKSTWFRTIFGEDFFTDTRFNLDDKDALMGLQGVWGWEIAELSSITGKSAEKVKAHLSSQVDRFRRPYAKIHETAPRSTVFVGTTNQQQFLMDDTGGRRFWVIRIGRIDLDWLRENRDQLWAEAVDRFREGETWWLGPEEEAMMIEARSEHEVEDEPWIESLVDYATAMANTPGASLKGVSLQAVLTGLNQAKANGDPWKLSRAHVMRAAEALKAVGWAKARFKVDGQCKWLWLPEGRQPSEGVVPDCDLSITEAAIEAADKTLRNMRQRQQEHSARLSLN